MDFVDALRVLGRRWRILLVGGLLTLVAAAAGILLVPTNYQSAGQLVLLLPPGATGPTPTNPYLNLEPGLTVTASLIAATLTTEEARRTVEEAGFTSEYSIGLDPSAGPILEISAEDTDAAMAVRTRDEVMRRLQSELLRIQVEENAPRRQLIGARPNSVPPVAEPLPGSKIRAVAVIGVLGLALTLVVAFVRDRRKRGVEAIPAGPDPVPPPEDATSDDVTAAAEERPEAAAPEQSPGQRETVTAQPVPRWDR